MTRTWPDDWESRKQGVGCPFCVDLTSRSFHSGRTSEALLERHAIATGHTAVVFRRRHVAALTDLAPGELADYWLDIQDVGRAIERVFKPCHVNYQLLGNMVPHLHCMSFRDTSMMPRPSGRCRLSRRSSRTKTLPTRFGSCERR